MRKEACSDLAYRCVMPSRLGRALGTRASTDQETGPPAGDAVSEEEYAIAREGDEAAREGARRQAGSSELKGGIRIATALALGIRQLRAVYAEQVNAWKRLWLMQQDRIF